MASATEATDEATIKLYGTTKSKVKILPSDGHLGLAIDNLLVDPRQCVLALDFDQTITFNATLAGGKKELQVRGGQPTKDALRAFVDKGGVVMVITVMVSLAKELVKLKIADIFDVEDWDKKPLINLMQSWGEDSSLTFDQLSKKLAVYVIISSLQRYANDLARVGGPLMTNFTANRAKMDYFLQCLEEDNPNKGDWSAKQFVPTVFPTPLPKEAADEYKVIAADTIKVWTEYLKRTRDWRPSIDRRTRDQLREDGDDGKPEFTLDAKKKYSYQCRLFLHETEEIVSDHEGEKMHRPLNEKELMDMVASVMREANISEKHISRVVKDPITLITHDGVALARYVNLFASAYNKPSALDYFLKDQEKKSLENAEIKLRDTLVFVDDNSDNAWNMYCHFAQQEVQGIQTKYTMSSFWFPAPEGGRDEKHHPPFRYLLENVSKLHEKN